MQPKLSILICTLEKRDEMFKLLYAKLAYQYSGEDVEIISSIDNGEMSVGEKRNNLLEQAKGEWVAFADDDDRVSSDYIKELLSGIETGADVITFQVSVSLNGATPKLCYYSKNFDADYNEPNAYFRLPNHLMCVKRELALQVPFKEVNFGEDADYAKRLQPLLKTEHSIDKVLYHYDFYSEKTETQRR
jgi:glycosyltransferase involved in cell wall biosynthesis